HAKAVVVPLAEPYREVFGIWMVEAMASGTPVFTTALGACEELVVRMTGGVATNPEVLETGLRMFLKGDFEFDPGMCRRRAQLFDIRETVKAYGTVVESK